MFCFRILKSTQVPQSFLLASALPPPLRSSLLSLSHFLFTGFALFVALSFSGFLLSLSLSLHTQTTATAAAALLARLIPFASQFLQLRFVPTFAANRKIRKHITTNALCEQFFLLFLHFFTMFSPCCALAFVFVFLSAAPFASFGPLPLASVRPQIAQSTWNVNAVWFDFHSRDLCCTIAPTNTELYSTIYGCIYIAVSRSSILDSRFSLFDFSGFLGCCSLRVWLSQSVVVYSRAAGRCLRCEAMNFSWILIRDFSPPSSLQIASASATSLPLPLRAEMREQLLRLFAMAMGLRLFACLGLGLGLWDAELGFA